MSVLEKISPSLDVIEKNKNTALSLAKEMLSAENGAMYPVDLLATGAIKRFLSTSSAFRLLVESNNLVSARSILRIHLDTAMRFHAVWLVSDPHKFASDVLAGKQINRMKDRDGIKLTDSYLSSKLAEEYNWIPTVYTNLCGYIHFSSSHLFSPIKDLNENDRSFSFEISDTDNNYPDFSWEEIVDCFNETSEIFFKYLCGWIQTKTITGEKKKDDLQKNDS